MIVEDVYVPELRSWIGTADFYLEELEIFSKRLEEVSTKNTASNIRASVEHFENQFTVQKDNLQVLKHDIHTQQEAIAKDAKKESRLRIIDAVDTEFLLRERTKMQEKIFAELKDSFHRFLAKVL